MLVYDKTDFEGLNQLSHPSFDRTSQFLHESILSIQPGYIKLAQKTTTSLDVFRISLISLVPSERERMNQFATIA